MALKPQYIKKSDTIGITAPSFGCTTEPYATMHDIAVRKIENRGYHIIEGETVHKSDGIGISTKPEIAAKELTKFYNRNDISAIISAGGGELMNETITYVDFEELKTSNPKWFMGYSDNTNFIFPLVTISGVQAVYGPCISGFAKEWEETEEDAFSLLEGTKREFTGYEKFVMPQESEDSEEKLQSAELNEKSTEFEIKYNYNRTKELSLYSTDNNRRLLKDNSEEIQMHGILLGGCLDVLANLVGTRFDRMNGFIRENNDIIWILEACDLTPMSIRRSLWNLREAGWFESAAGFVIGRPLNAFNMEMMGVDRFNAVTDILNPLGKPVIMDADIGHIDPMLPVVMGAEAEIIAEYNDLQISYM